MGCFSYPIPFQAIKLPLNLNARSFQQLPRRIVGPSIDGRLGNVENFLLEKRCTGDHWNGNLMLAGGQFHELSKQGPRLQELLKRILIYHVLGRCRCPWSTA